MRPPRGTPTPPDPAAPSGPSSRTTRWPRSGSGPAIARLFHGLLGACGLLAWLSLGVQVRLLIGSDGLLPVAPLVDSLAEVEGAFFRGFPSFLLLDASNATLLAGVGLGAGLSTLALLGVWPRPCFALSAVLYLGYVVAARDFLSFQWDNLLIECMVLAAFLPRDAPSNTAHWVMRGLLFKLYFESGLAKAQSHLGDWFDGSAMSFYYETAPLPAWPGWWAHQLPEAWHALESYGALGLETLGAWLILGPRPARLAALVGFTGFQLINLATANYGFFVYLALALHVFLLDDDDLVRLRAWLRERGVPRLPRPSFRPWLPRAPAATPRWQGRLRVSGALLAIAWAAASFNTAIAHFGAPSKTVDAAIARLQPYRVYRVANAYHLFGHITRERVEPEIQIRSGSQWRSHDLHHKPGRPERAPGFVAPHQPRVDFRLWFYGLSYARGAPRYVQSLLERLCNQPASMQPLFVDPLPNDAEAVRIEYWRYHFTTRSERQASGRWWRRESVERTPDIPCRELVRRDAG